MTKLRETNVDSVEYRTLTNRLTFDSKPTSKEKGEMHDILRKRREKYRKSGKYNNMIIKAHNRERNNYDKKRVPLHLRKYTYFDDEED